MEYCDHGHTAEEVRLFPTGGGAHVIVCRFHYAQEMRYRRWMHSHGYMPQAEFPKWNDLKVYKGGE